MVNQDEIHRMAQSENVKERREAIVQFKTNFTRFYDKEQAWNDLFTLAKDKNSIVQGTAVSALCSIFPNSINKEQAWNDLIALLKNKDSDIWRHASDLDFISPYVMDKNRASEDMVELERRQQINLKYASYSVLTSDVGTALGSAFSHISDKKQAWEDLHNLVYESNPYIKECAASALSLAFPYISDKKQAWEDLHTLAQDEYQNVRRRTASALGLAFPHIPDKKQARLDLIRLKYNTENTRRIAGLSFSNYARYYIENKNYELASHCFFLAASAFDEILTIKNADEFYLFNGLGCYYKGRALVSDLSEINNPKNYIKNIKQAVNLFNKSIKYIEKSHNKEYEAQTRFFPVCLNIYSAYYEYNLSLKNLDEKRINKVQKYLDDASKQCSIIGTKKGDSAVKLFKNLTETLMLRLNEITLETEKQEANIKGKGLGEKATYEIFIEKSRKEFKEHIAELGNSLTEMEMPVIKKIAEFEKERLEKLEAEKEKRLLPKSLWNLYENYIMLKWKEIIAVLLVIGTILATLVEIIKNLEILSEIIK